MAHLFYDGYHVIRSSYELSEINESFLYLTGISVLNHPLEAAEVDLDRLQIDKLYEDSFETTNNQVYSYDVLVKSWISKHKGSDVNIQALMSRLSEERDFITFLYGVSRIACKHGYLTRPSGKDLTHERGIFNIRKQSRAEKALTPANQLKVFMSVLEERPTLLTGGTGIGKTRYIPLLTYYFSYLIETTLLAFNSQYEVRDVMLSIPRQMLVDSPVDGMLNYMGFTDVPKDLPSLMKYQQKRSILRKEAETQKYESFPREGTFIVVKYGFKDDSLVRSCLKCKLRRGVRRGLCNSCFNENLNPIRPTLYIGTSQSLIPLVERCRTVIIDEFHEHDIWSDIVYAKARALRINHIFMITATPDSDISRLRSLHPSLMRIDIPGIAFPIRDIVISEGKHDLFTLGTPPNKQQADHKALELTKIYELLSSKIIPFLKNGQAVIIFFSSSNECISFARESRNIFSQVENLMIVPTYSGSEEFEMSKGLFSSMKTILPSTNVVESSITIDQAVIVIDSGRQIVVKNGLPNEVYISSSQQTQRRGRVGRVKPGTYYSLFDPKKLSRSSLVKIDYEDVSVLVLSMLYYNISEKDLFYEVTPARSKRFFEAYKKLINYKLIVRGQIDVDMYNSYCRYSNEPIQVIRFLSANENLKDLFDMKMFNASKIRQLIRAIPSDIRNSFPYRNGVVLSVNQNRLEYMLDDQIYTNNYPGADLSSLRPQQRLRFFNSKIFRELAAI
jgi:hypothetical protein